MTSKEKIEELHSFIDSIANKLGIIDYLVYQHSLDDIEEDLEILDILKPRINLKESSLKNIHFNFDEQGNIIMEQDLKETPVVFIQSSGFVFENSAEHKALKRWLNE